MKISQREILLAWITGVVAVGGLTYAFCEPRVEEYRRLRQERRRVQEKIALDQRLVSQKPMWDSRLRTLSAGLPEFPEDRDVTADLLIILDRIASNNGVSLPRRDADKEKRHGYAYQLAVTCKWEGSLESLVHFLFELQEQGAMLDLSQLSVAPEKTALKGSFTAECTYRKVKTKEAAEGAGPMTPAAKATSGENAPIPPKTP
jgi:Tfp pilus assembly protein PilO